jgi:ABC-type bacteriocin/lantibiotic exporter with double-glycine peptidase domain
MMRDSISSKKDSHTMRGLAHAARGAPPAPDVPGAPRSDWTTLARLLPYLWRYRGRVLIALGFMICAKLANIGVPLLLKELVDGMAIQPGSSASLLVVPVGLLIAYGALRLSTTLFTELRELVFAKATEGAARRISLGYFATCTPSACVSTSNARPAA